MHDGILNTVGRTPLVRLRRVFADAHFLLFAKLEAFNPGGSIKDRAALNIIQRALESGEIDQRTTIIESSSGNMGIGLAQACAYLGLRFICVVDPKTTGQNIKILKTYGAEIDLVTRPDPVSGEFLQARIDRVRELLRTTPHGFWPNQYANLNNARAHHQTMQEIISDVGAPVDYLFCATSSCGTIRGCAEYALEHGLQTKIIAVDAAGSAIFGSPPAKRLIPGHGAARVPELHKPELIHTCIHVSDADCVNGCRRLVRQEGILAGGSSGAVLMAVESMSPRIASGAVCVMILPDRGERYLDTIYSDEWVSTHFPVAEEVQENLESLHV